MWGFIFFVALLPLPLVFHHETAPVITPRTAADSLLAINEKYGSWESRLFLKNGVVYNGFTQLVRDSVRLRPEFSAAFLSFANATVHSVEFRNHKRGSQIGMKSGLKAGAIAGGTLGLVGGVLLALAPEPDYVSDPGEFSQPSMKRSKYYGWADWPGYDGWGSPQKKHKWTYPIIGAVGGAAVGGSIGSGLGYMIGADAAGRARVRIAF